MTVLDTRPYDHPELRRLRELERQVAELEADRRAREMRRELHELWALLVGWSAVWLLVLSLAVRHG